MTTEITEKNKTKENINVDFKGDLICFQASINKPNNQNCKKRNSTTTFYPKWKIRIFVGIFGIINRNKSENRSDEKRNGEECFQVKYRNH